MNDKTQSHKLMNNEMRITKQPILGMMVEIY